MSPEASGHGTRLAPSHVLRLIALIQITDHALRDGCSRAQDLFLLSRLRNHDEAARGLDATYGALGVDAEMREHLRAALRDLVPVRGMPAVEAMTVASMLAGVLVGLLIADSTLPTEELDLPILPGR